MSTRDGVSQICMKMARLSHLLCRAVALIDQPEAGKTSSGSRGQFGSAEIGNWRPLFPSTSLEPAGENDIHGFHFLLLSRAFRAFLVPCILLILHCDDLDPMAPFFQGDDRDPSPRMRRARQSGVAWPEKTWRASRGRAS